MSSQALSSRLTPIKRAAQKWVTHAMVAIRATAATTRAAMARPENLILLDFVRGSFYNIVHQIKLKPDQWRCPACPARCRTSMR